MSRVRIAPCRERWKPGQRAWFEYHCWEDPESADAEIWYRSHERVTILSGPSYDGKPVEPDPTWPFHLRQSEGSPNCYEVLFADGLQWTVFEDELFTSKSGFYRPAPPTRSKA